SFSFTDTSSTTLSTLSLHDALPIYPLPLRLRPSRHAAVLRKHPLDRRDPQPVHHRHRRHQPAALHPVDGHCRPVHHLLLGPHPRDRKSTRLNSSHVKISYAVFCLKK